MFTLSARVEKFLTKLPDPASARLFIERLDEEHPSISKAVVKNDELLANILTLAAYSPLLAETMLQRPEYINWLERERDLEFIKPKEGLMEELARFAAVNSTLDEPTRLARFKRRELLRIYLRDCLKLATVSETTAELSNLADAVMERALQSCYQPLLARYGAPQRIDERGRLLSADFAIIGMGKLGSYELNYSSDIDLIFIYSADGETAGRNESIPNKLFFSKLAEAIVKMVATPYGEGAVFRVDLRLRPRGREGALVVSVAEMTRYYREEAQKWECQALVRARATAGNNSIVEQFLQQVHSQIFHPEPLVEALRAVKLAKEKIDSQVATRQGGFNVKLGKGGIREIEFIVQALQICYGGRDAWLRAPQTLIGLQRLSDKQLLSDSEHTRLAHAYVFLRMVEHRLQMEYGLQTHSLPLAEEKLALLARRCGFSNQTDFDQALTNHCRQVSAVYQRVFDQTTPVKRITQNLPGLSNLKCENNEVNQHTSGNENSETIRADTVSTDAAVEIDSQTSSNRVAATFDRGTIEALFQEAAQALIDLPNLSLAPDMVDNAIIAGLAAPINGARALRRLRDFALSAATETGDRALSKLDSAQIRELTIIGGISHYFSQLLISHPFLIKRLGNELSPSLSSITAQTMRELLSCQIADLGFEEMMAQLRRCWHEESISIGRHDLLTPIITNQVQTIDDLRNINLAQTALAEAALTLASEVACQKASERFGRTDQPLTYTILGLGRLGHRGIDYNSDLDLVFVYSDEGGNVAENATNQEFYARVLELIIQILSSLKREGMLYNVDLRLRPDGRNGTLATSFDKLQNYLQEHAAIWELMAYLKLRPVSGDQQFGSQVEKRALELIFARGQALSATLAQDARNMRARLQTEKGRAEDYKFSAGGMLDVYFISRFLQLRHAVADPPERGTTILIDQLAQLQLINADQHDVLKEGYSFLRRLDHQVRLQLERPQSILPHNPTQLFDIARRLGITDGDTLLTEFQRHRSEIRNVYQQLI